VVTSCGDARRKVQVRLYAASPRHVLGAPTFPQLGCFLCRGLTHRTADVLQHSRAGGAECTGDRSTRLDRLPTQSFHTSTRELPRDPDRALPVHHSHLDWGSVGATQPRPSLPHSHQTTADGSVSHVFCLHCHLTASRSQSRMMSIQQSHRDDNKNQDGGGAPSRLLKHLKRWQGGEVVGGAA